MGKKHQKHANITKKFNDNFATNEVAILGTKCGVIADLVTKVSTKLSNYNLGYFDASHAKDLDKNIVTEYTFHHEGNLQVNTTSSVNKFEQRLQFINHDFVLINGNHYEGAKQILILDDEKEASIEKRLDQITNIQFIVKLNSDTKIFDCLIEKFPLIENTTCYTIHDVDKITNHIHNLIKENIAPVKGLVLTGGKSTRMGTDKSELDYYGKPQKEYTKELLENNALETFYSVQLPSKKPAEIHDTFLNLGPFGGICSAFQKDPNSAWLVVATDLPFVNDELIQLLLQKRNPSKIATAIKGKSKEFPEPLITIYEPKAYTKLLQYLAQGYSCPRKVLINSDVEIIEIDDHLIRNINTPEEFETAKKEISKYE
ncbi:NTP transferase domain-containing protein [Tenacibaculum sp. HL-MS23]|uniref:NTP transferase domain-containing protein n=1 Tax=unclassified Tenacibaculum TaxID=2635139 RepID=UPI001C4EA728|nr:MULTISPECIES: NTP transferase domain-containing protein [unclassified Tenacibaculum]QXP73065.1 NTP transferase domain-containing protein [Tenacibaculum sp. AHE14PA]QXP76979.1 NTP transferase domain-containing protein [Tenacibaculum sp. AHE15PA]WNW01111.1 NTP transferase domain-containing protein [Tenacibaculum sp. HL-MS23]